jgi:hypothetical protein
MILLQFPPKAVSVQLFFFDSCVLLDNRPSQQVYDKKVA